MNGAELEEYVMNRRFTGPFRTNEPEKH